MTKIATILFATALLGVAAAFAVRACADDVLIPIATLRAEGVKAVLVESLASARVQ